jgi:hypothetical protein
MGIRIRIKRARIQGKQSLMKVCLSPPNGGQAIRRFGDNRFIFKKDSQMI